MKKVMLALFAVLTLAACMGTYKQGNCEYDFLLHKDISISKLIGNATGAIFVIAREHLRACIIYWIAAPSAMARNDKDVALS